MAPEAAATVEEEGTATEGGRTALGPAVGSVPRDGEGTARRPREARPDIGGVAPSVRPSAGGGDGVTRAIRERSVATGGVVAPVGPG